MIEYKLSLAGCECAVVEWNPGGSVTVFALHGWLDNLATFESLITYLPELRIIAVDFPGHGHSAHITEGMLYHFYDGLFMLDDLARHFGHDKINLLGHSMGAALSSIYAASQPERVNSLLMIESLGPLTAEAEDVKGLFDKAICQRRGLRNKRKPIYKTFNEALVARAEASKIEPELVIPLVERGLSNIEAQPGYTWRADSRLRTTSPLRMSESHLRELLSGIVAPVLVIEGSEGYLVNQAKFQERKQQIKQLEVVSVKGGHHVHLEEPAETARLIQQFFVENV